MPILAAGLTFTPLMIAALMAWILCVCVHEFSHALVAFWGGDRSVRDKGYLTLDPTRFIDPVFSLLIPAIVLMFGGFPLPGGSVLIDRSRLRSARWGTYVSAAGPASNFILFVLLAIPLHPGLGLVDPFRTAQPTWVFFLGAMAMLNFIALLFNLIPVPPLDGFGIIENRLDPELRWKLRQPQVAFGCIGLVFLVLMVKPEIFFTPALFMLDNVCTSLGLPVDLMQLGYLVVMHDQDPSALLGG